jgi:hypothetical protein
MVKWIIRDEKLPSRLIVEMASGKGGSEANSKGKQGSAKERQKA